MNQAQELNQAAGAEVEESEHTQVEATDVPQSDADQVETPAAPVAPAWSLDDEDEARLFGWKSPDEWQGEVPKGYIDNPEDFLNRVQKSKIFKTMTERLETTTAGLERVNDMALRRQQEQHEAAIAAARKQRDDAFQSGDDDAYKEANEREQALLAKPVEAPIPRPPAEVEAYRNSENGAWLQNPILQKTAAELVGSRPDILAKPPSEQIAFAEAEMRKMYPAYFPAPKAAKTPPRQVVDAGGLAGAGRSPFDKLPEDAKATFTRFVKQGIFEDNAKDRKEYADEYAKAAG